MKTLDIGKVPGINLHPHLK